MKQNQKNSSGEGGGGANKSATERVAHLNLRNQIKKEKTEYDAMIVSRRSSTSSTRSSANFQNEITNGKVALTKTLDHGGNNEGGGIRISIENENEEVKPNIEDILVSNNDELSSTNADVEAMRPKVLQNVDVNIKSKAASTLTNKLKPGDFFITNPITNYFNYNKEASGQFTEQHLADWNEWTRCQFEKHKIEKCTVGLFDLGNLDFLKSEQFFVFFYLFMSLTFA